VRETVSDTIEEKLPGSQDAIQAAIQGIILNDNALILRVHEDTYRLPRQCTDPRQLLDWGEKQRQAKYAIMNDGMSPAQLKALRENRRLYVQAERKRRALLEEEKVWCDYLRPAE
jgi:hypothetical protein